MENKNERITRLNNQFRRTFAGGRVVYTSGISSLTAQQREEIVSAVRKFETFDPEDDPYGEHDFGALEVAGRSIFWKIDYYDAALAGGSKDPADPSVTTRVLTIMLAEEY